VYRNNHKGAREVKDSGSFKNENGWGIRGGKRHDRVLAQERVAAQRVRQKEDLHDEER